MAIEALTAMPAELYAGATWKVSRSWGDYPAGDSWAVVYYFVNASATPFSVTCSADGDAHVMTVSSTDSASKTAGTWFWEARATKSGETVVVEKGRVEVKPNLATVAAASDQRSFNRRVLDLLEATFEGRATTSALETEVNTGQTTRKIKHMTHEQLLSAISRFKYLVAQEERTERRGSNLRLGSFN